MPDAALSDYPTILDFAAPTLYSYSRETTVAEKFEAMVKLAELNSRMKDFFDIWLLSRQFDFDGSVLTEAVQRTFANRGTTITSRPAAWHADFGENAAKQSQWTGFLRKARLENTPVSFLEVTSAVSTFLRPVARTIESGETFEMRWKAPGPWA